MSELVDKIFKELSKSPRIIIPAGDEPPNSHVLMVGCVDARINTKMIRRLDESLIFPDGKSPIRNIGARIVAPDAPGGKEQTEMLRKAIEEKGVDRIVIVGHTHCGGIRASWEQGGGEDLKYYLKSFDRVRDTVKNPKADIAARKLHSKERALMDEDDANRRDLEAMSVLDSVANLKKHLALLNTDKKITIEPYLLNTANQHAIDLNPDKNHNIENYYVMDQPPEHKPEMLIFTSWNEHLFPQDDLNIEDGKALIHRTSHGLVKGKTAATADEKAMVEFALANNVKDIVVLEKIMPDTSEKDRADMEHNLCKSRELLHTYPELEKRVRSGDIQLHAWLFNDRGRLLQANDADMFVPVGNSRSR